MEECDNSIFNVHLQVKMSVSEVLIQLILASALGVPLLVFLGFVGLRQFKLILTILSELSSPRGSLPAIIRPCTSPHSDHDKCATQWEFEPCNALLTIFDTILA